MLFGGRIAWSGAVSAISSAGEGETISDTLRWTMRIGYIAEVLFVAYMLALLLSCYRCFQRRPLYFNHRMLRNGDALSSVRGDVYISLRGERATGSRYDGVRCYDNRS